MTQAATEIDLTDRLRLAAGSLASDFGDDISVERAEALVFRSAEGLLAAASVMEFIPILAERRARLALRTALPADPATIEAPPGPSAAEAARAADPAPTPRLESLDAPHPPVQPRLAVPERELAQLRDSLERLRRRLTG